MTTPLAEAATSSRDVAQRSVLAKRMAEDLRALPPEVRRMFMAELDVADLRQVFAACQRHFDTAYFLWEDAPADFVTDILGETIWSKQRAVLDALVLPEVKRVIVPAAFGTGKTHIAAKAVCWFGCVYPVGTSTGVTTATRMRQVIRQLWPHVRKTVARAGLPGDCDTTQWKMDDKHGVETVVAYGFSAPEHDEAAMQGIHAARLLLIVDEAGGFARGIGNSTRNLLTGDARMLAIGNPATDDESSWFETAAEDGFDPARADTVTIPIAAADSPAISGEDAGPCKDCPSSIPTHPLAQHLVDDAWVADAIREHGDDAPYVIAKVFAKFPKGGGARAIPSSYVDAGMEQASPDFDDEDLRADGTPSVDLRGHPYATQPNRGAWIRLGVDVAADGGDEFVVARAEGDIARIRTVQSGAVNQNSVDVAGKILEEIRAAVILAEAIGTDLSVLPITVKVDAIGVGWGVVSTLETWSREGVVPKGVTIIRAVVSELPDQPDNPKSMWRPKNKRAELWLNGRQLLTPDPSGRVALRLDIDHKVAAQLRSPKYGTDASGRQFIESKKDIVARLGSAQGKSPDRAEALLLAVYEPRNKKRAKIMA
jgi:hypothetical protein